MKHQQTFRWFFLLGLLFPLQGLHARRCRRCVGAGLVKKTPRTVTAPHTDIAFPARAVVTQLMPGQDLDSLANDYNVMLYFYSSSCVACKEIHERLHHEAAALKGIKFIAVDIDNPAFALYREKYVISEHPALVLYKRGGTLMAKGELAKSRPIRSAQELGNGILGLLYFDR